MPAPLVYRHERENDHLRVLPTCFLNLKPRSSFVNKLIIKELPRSSFFKPSCIVITCSVGEQLA